MDQMSQSKEDRAGWQDEGLVPVALLLLGYAGVLAPTPVWALAGVALMIVGALITVAMWQGAAMRKQAPSAATRWAVSMLKAWGAWALIGRVLMGWLSQ